MISRRLADNWTFQNAGEFLEEGLQGDTANELVVPEHGDEFHYQEASADLLRFDALCQLLNHLVLSDEVWVDGAYTGTWGRFEPLASALDARVVIPKPFTEIQSDWVDAREAIADELCANNAIREAHIKNKQQWERDQTTPDPMLSQLIWGGAGMLARAERLKLPYSPHPLRENLVRRACAMGTPDAESRLKAFITTERLKIQQLLGSSGFVGTVQLPPVVIEVIEATSDLHGLIPAALQLRNDYKAVRKWLAQLQNDLGNENIKEVLAQEKRLADISHHLSTFSTCTAAGNTTFQLSVGVIKASTKGLSPIDGIRNRFGMRAEVSRLVMTKTGHSTLKKLLRMLGEQHTSRGRQLEANLAHRSIA